MWMDKKLLKSSIRVPILVVEFIIYYFRFRFLGWCRWLRGPKEFLKFESNWVESIPSGRYATIHSSTMYTGLQFKCMCPKLGFDCRVFVKKGGGGVSEATYQESWRQRRQRVIRLRTRS